MTKQNVIAGIDLRQANLKWSKQRADQQRKARASMRPTPSPESRFKP
ncbi:hypothetical protein ACFFYR_02060 [Paraburkholderia dipogonis]